MTPKERAAIQQALEALEEIHVVNMTPMAEENWKKAITALRESLEHHKPHDECECNACLNYCTDRAHEEALAEQAEQEPVGYWQGKFSQDGGAVLYEVPQASAFGYHYPNYPVYAAPQPVKQEPVGVFANVNALTPEKGARWEQMIDSAYDGVEYIHLYAAPVRTKDLTDDEVAKAYMECTGGDIIARCRAVIAADREKNK